MVENRDGDNGTAAEGDNLGFWQEKVIFVRLTKEDGDSEVRGIKGVTVHIFFS